MTLCLSPLARAWTPSWKVGEGSAKQCQTGCCWNRRKEEIFKTDGNLESVEWLIKGLASTIKGPVSPLSLLSVTSPLLKMQKPPHPSPFPTPSSTGTMLPTYWASSDTLRSAVSADITNLCDSPWGQSQPAGRRRSPSGLLLCHTSGDSSSVAPIGRHLQQPLLPCQSTACGFKSVRWGQEFFSSPIYVSFFLSHLTRNWCHKSFCRPLIWVTSAKGPTLCIGCLPALGWNGKKQRSAQNVWCTNRVKKIVLFLYWPSQKMSQVIKRKEEPNQGVKEAAMTPVNQGRELRRVGWVREQQRIASVWLHTLDDFQTLSKWWNAFSFPCNSPSEQGDCFDGFSA